MLSRMLSLAWDGLDNFPVRMDGWMDEDRHCHSPGCSRLTLYIYARWHIVIVASPSRQDTPIIREMLHQGTSPSAVPS